MENIKTTIKPILERYRGETGALIPVLQDIQEKYKFIPPESVEIVSDFFDIPVTRINGVITFYAQFRSEPVGEHILRICHGTACFVNGGETLLDFLKDLLGVEEGETTEDNVFTLEKVACLGCCSLAPVIMIDDEVYGKLNNKKLKEIIEKYRKKEAN